MDIYPNCNYELWIGDAAADGWGNSFLGVVQGDNQWTFTMGPGEYEQTFPIWLETDELVKIFYFEVGGAQTPPEEVAFQTLHNSFKLTNADSVVLMYEGWNPFADNGQGALQPFQPPFFQTYSALPFCGTLCIPTVLGCTDDGLYITFIGTGLTVLGSPHYQDLAFSSTDDYDFIIDGVTVKEWVNGTTMKHIQEVCQNLPYGTHIFQMKTNANAGAHWMRLNDVTFHQPKKPPVPEDACILADYMLMADFVAQTGHGLGKLSKGTRCNWASRDFFYDSGTDWALEGPHMAIASGLRTYNNQNEKQIDLPTFGHGFVSRFLANTDRSSNTTYKVNDDVYDTNFNASGTYTAGNRIGTTSPNPWDISANDGTVTFDHNGNGTDAVEFAGIKNLQLGVNNLTFDDNTTDYIVFDGVEVVTPIHTSSHYQTFETPYLHELVGGDRNMEQTNLIVTADGKSWDEVTRDTSYLGPSAIVSASRDGGHKSSANNYDFDYHRGIANKKEMYNKNIAIAFDRFVILEDGIYEVMLHTYNNTAATVIFLQKNSEAGNIDNGVILRAASADDTPNGIVVWELKRYDYVLVRVQNGGTNAMSGANPGYTQIVIKKLD